MLFTSLPWPSWGGDLGPEYTMYMPLNSRTSTVYDDPIPTLGNSSTSNNNQSSSLHENLSETVSSTSSSATPTSSALNNPISPISSNASSSSIFSTVYSFFSPQNDYESVRQNTEDNITSPIHSNHTIYYSDEENGGNNNINRRNYNRNNRNRRNNTEDEAIEMSFR